MQNQEVVLRRSEPLATITMPLFDEGTKQNLVECEFCNSLFPKQKEKRFCSFVCLREYNNKVLREPKRCRSCNISHKGTGLYCLKCSPSILPCAYCKKTFKRSFNEKYCSQICMNRHLTKVRFTSNTKICSVCTVAHSRSKKTCSPECHKLLPYARKSPIQHRLNEGGGQYERCANWACRKQLGVIDYGKAHNFCSKGCHDFTVGEYISCEVCRGIGWQIRSPYKKRIRCYRCLHPRSVDGYIPSNFKIIHARDKSKPTAVLCNLLCFLNDQEVYLRFNDLGINAGVTHNKGVYKFKLNTVRNSQRILPYTVYCIHAAIKSAFIRHSLCIETIKTRKCINTVIMEVKSRKNETIVFGLVKR